VKHDLSIQDNFAFLFWKKIKRYRKGKLYNPKTKIKKRKKTKNKNKTNYQTSFHTSEQLQKFEKSLFFDLIACHSKRKKIGEKNFKTNKMVPT
jgi:hypothetical protein